MNPNDLPNPSPVFPERVRELAQAMARGNALALELLYDHTSPRLFRYALLLTGMHADAEDVLQAAFVRIARHPSRLAAANHPWAYFLKVLRNEGIRHHRSKKPVAWLGDYELPVADSTLSAEDAEIREFVRAAIKKLPASQSEVVVLKIWEGMTFQEIADILGESPNTAASRYRYALEKLARTLEPISRQVGYV